MAIVVHCEKCGSRFKAPDSAAGRDAKCPKCGETIFIPESDMEVESAAAPRRETRSSAGAEGSEDDSAISGRRARKQLQSGRFMEFLTFRTMLLPLIIQVVFWLGIFGVVGFGVFSMVNGAFVYGLLSTIAGVILWRIYCELMIVFFRINDTLTDIKNILQQQKQT